MGEFVQNDNKDLLRENLRQVICVFLSGLMNYPEDCKVFMSKGVQTTVYQIDLNQKDFGRLMGTRGRTINALRTLVNAISGAKDFRAIVQIKDEERFF